MAENVSVKTRMKDPDTGQWVKVWPSVPASDEQKAAQPAENKARKAAPENKAAR